MQRIAPRGRGIEELLTCGPAQYPYILIHRKVEPVLPDRHATGAIVARQPEFRPQQLPVVEVVEVYAGQGYAVDALGGGGVDVTPVLGYAIDAHPRKGGEGEGLVVEGKRRHPKSGGDVHPVIGPEGQPVDALVATKVEVIDLA